MKAPEQAKSRLRETRQNGPRLPDATELATAFLLDVVQAASRATRVAEVLVISPDTAVATVLHNQSSRFLVQDHDPTRAPAVTGINQAITQATLAIRATNPGTSVAAITGDLAALSSDSLDAALALADAFATTCFVADRQDTGTTALLLPRGTWTAPQFGAGSATAHRAAGIREISDDVGLDLRTDVDTADDLAEAIDLGVGPNTARLMS